MMKQIIQQLLEHQTFTAASAISVRLRQPLPDVENELKAMKQMYPTLLTLNFDTKASTIYVRIAEDGEQLARTLLSGQQR